MQAYSLSVFLRKPSWNLNISKFRVGFFLGSKTIYKVAPKINSQKNKQFHGGAGGKRQNEESILVNPSDNECRSAEFLPHSILQWQTGNDLNIQNKKTIKSVMTHLCGGILFSHESHVLKKYGKMFKIDHQVEKTDYEIGYIL